LNYTITYQDDGGVVINYSGPITGQEAMAVDQEVYTSTAYPISNVSYIIADYSDTTDFNYPPGIVKVIAQIDKIILEENPDLLIAVVSKTSLGFGLARMWQVHTQMDERSLVFRTREEAEDWVQMKLIKK